MIVRMLGAAMVLCGSAFFGISAAVSLRRTIAQLKMLDTAFHLMDCELRFISPPLPRLLRTVAKDTAGPVSALFSNLAAILADPATKDPEAAMRLALERTKHLNLPAGTVFSLLEFAQTLGRYDLSGQLSAVQSVRTRLSGQLENLLAEQKGRCRIYETLGICAGAAVVILIL